MMSDDQEWNLSARLLFLSVEVKKCEVRPVLIDVEHFMLFHFVVGHGE